MGLIILTSVIRIWSLVRWLITRIHSSLNLFKSIIFCASLIHILLQIYNLSIKSIKKNLFYLWIKILYVFANIIYLFAKVIKIKIKKLKLKIKK